MTREEWLEAAVQKLRPIIEREGETVPPVKVSVGLPGYNRGALGCCFWREAAADGVSQIFISPVLDDILAPSGVLATLLHEMCHAALPDGTSHKKPFAKLAEAVGLEGEPTATHSGVVLEPLFKRLAAELGPYPHARLDLSTGRKKQTTRMIKCECQHCGYTCRTTRKWADSAGPPWCPIHHEPMEIDE